MASKRRRPARTAQRNPRAKPPTPKTRAKGGAKRPVSRAQARLYGVVSRKGSRSTGKAAGVARTEMNRVEARSSLRGVAVSTLPPRKRSTSTSPKPDPAPTARPKRQRTPAQRAATRRANARRAAGL